MPYAQDGEGDPVLFVHGSNADHRVWDAHRDLMAQHCRMIRLTMRYFGTDAWPDNGENFSMQVHAEDLAAFIRGLKLEPVTLVGWSWGAGVCLTMAVQDPSLVKRMFLYEPALATFVADKKTSQAALQDRIAMSEQARMLAEAGALEGTVHKFMDGVNSQTGAFSGLSTDVRKVMTENARMLPLLFTGPPPPPVKDKDLQDLALPVTIALGSQSRSFYRITAHTAHAPIPSSELKVIEGARHLLPVQRPEEFCQAVLDFLGQDQSVELQ
nr:MULTISPECIES: alpha/beta hydrolase [unclassified Ruegeria]